MYIYISNEFMYTCKFTTAFPILLQYAKLTSKSICLYTESMASWGFVFAQIMT